MTCKRCNAVLRQTHTRRGLCSACGQLHRCPVCHGRGKTHASGGHTPTDQPYTRVACYRCRGAGVVAPSKLRPVLIT